MGQTENHSKIMGVNTTTSKITLNVNDLKYSSSMEEMASLNKNPKPNYVAYVRHLL